MNFHGLRLDRSNIGPKLKSSLDQKPDDDPLKCWEENHANLLRFQFKQVDINHVKKAFMGLKFQNHLGLRKLLQKL